ncbi:MAG: YpdA family putative bacillithiol disulfide reductase [Gemmatimonadaceae bacterium]
MILAPPDGRERSGSVDVAIVGAGPCGLATAIAAGRQGLSAVVFDASCVVSSIARYPVYTTFFSSGEKLSIGDIPFVVAGDKPTRRDALAYYRAVSTHYGLVLRQYEPVVAIRRAEDSFIVRSRPESGDPVELRASAIVIATGAFGRENRLGVPGEDLSHVAHLFREGHEAFDRDAVVVGGGNSAAEAALELYRSGARVTLVHFEGELDRRVKPWVGPDLTNRIADGDIAVRWQSRVRAIEPGAVVLDTAAGGERLAASHVYLLTGHMPDVRLLNDLGARIDPGTGVPEHDPATMQTTVPGVYIAGVLSGGFDANRIFIENGRHHGTLIASHLSARHGASVAAQR